MFKKANETRVYVFCACYLTNQIKESKKKKILSTEKMGRGCGCDWEHSVRIGIRLNIRRLLKWIDVWFSGMIFFFNFSYRLHPHIIIIIILHFLINQIDSYWHYLVMLCAWCVFVALLTLKSWTEQLRKKEKLYADLHF